SAGAKVRFQPNANYTGPATLIFQAWDQHDGKAAGAHVNLAGSGATGGLTAYSTGSATAVLNVTATNTPPSFSLHTYTTFEDNTVVASGSQHGRNNQVISDPNFAFGINPGAAGGPVTFDVTVDPNDTSLFLQQPAIDANGTLTFQLAPDMFGVATLTVTASNSGANNNTSNPQTTTISVNAINDPPTLNPINDITLPENFGPNPATTTVNLTGISAGLDESQALTVTATSSNPGLVPNPTVTYTSPNTMGMLQFTPAVGGSGVATITVTVTDNGGASLGGVNTFTRSFTVTVLSPPPTAVAQSVTVSENSQQTITLGGNPPPGQSYVPAAAIASLPVHGSLYQTADGVTRGAAITALNTPVANAQNKVIYVPDPNQTADDSFSFTVSGGTPVQTSAPATVSITVAVSAQAPSFTAGANVQVSANSGPRTVGQWATNISAGTNASGQQLQFVVTNDTNAGLFSAAPAVDATNGNLTFTPALGATGTATISLVLRDPGNNNQSSTHTFTISVVSSSTPTAVLDAYILSDSASSQVSAGAGVLSNDGNSGGVTATRVSGPLHGTLVLQADGSFTYTPNGSFQGYDQFIYEAVNGSAVSTPTAVTLLSHQASIVDKVYHQVLNRAADLQGLQFWTAQIMQGQPYSIIAQGIFESDERLDPIVSQYYQQFLLRAPDPQGLQFWVNLWRQDGGPEHVVAGMISSPEFFAEAGNSHPQLSANAAWVTTLYERLLNREPDQQGLQFWTGNLDSGAMTREQVVLGFEQSPEAYTNDVNGFFQQYLNRAPTATELANYVGQLEHGATQRDIQMQLIDLPEYQNNPPLPPAGSMNRTTGL
ncbi:MAG TPA: DUF4214 domain-containing protein, partial [Pirellulales bacterium]|nr:DUF4214 domain-containing protein [Pirellulales bacterium]